MIEEIKRIIEELKDNIPIEECRSEGTSDGLTNYEEDKDSWQYKLLDYITNLQQLYENGLKVNQNSHKYITELEMNNAILKEELKNRPIVDFTFDVYKELEDYKSRCEKAIEYIKEHIKYECDDNFNGMSFYSYHLYDFKKEDLLNILNKGDVNETNS